MNQIPSALLEPPAPAPAKHGKEPPGGPPPDAPFAAVLDDHQARTATAEGHQRGDGVRRRDERRAHDRDDAVTGDATGDARSAAQDDAGATDAQPGAAANTSDAASAPSGSPLAALLGGVPLAAGIVVTAAPLAPSPQAEAAVPALPAAAPAVGPAPSGPAVPADATALPLRPPVPGGLSAQATASSPSVPTDAGAAAAESGGDGSAAPAAATVARATRLADVLQAASARPTAPAEPVATPAPATAAARAQSDAGGQASAQTAAPAAPPAGAPAATTAAPAPAALPTAAPEAPAAPSRGVGLEHAVETVRLALRAAADRNVSHARIALSPRELGGIEIHLRQTADGLVARVVAEHATAAQLLQHAGGELRRSLEAQGLTLLQLDVGASGEQGARNGDRRALAEGFAGDGDDSRRSSADQTDPLAPLDGATETASTTTTLALPNGALVDVLA